MKFKHVLLAILFAVSLSSCKKDEANLSKEELIESLNLNQTAWKGRYTDRNLSLDGNGENVPEIYEYDITISFPTKEKGRYQVDDSEIVREFEYTHNKSIVDVTSLGVSLRGKWWIVDITEDTLYLQKNMDLNDSRLLCELRLTRVY